MSFQKDLLTLGEVAKHFNCQLWHVQRVFERKMLPPPLMLAGCRWRFVRPDQLANVGEALVLAGYISAPQPVVPQTDTASAQMAG